MKMLQKILPVTIALAVLSGLPAFAKTPFSENSVKLQTGASASADSKAKVTSASKKRVIFSNRVAGRSSEYSQVTLGGYRREPQKR